MNWYRKLIALRGSNPALRSGSTVMLNHDAQNALVWMRKPAKPSLDDPALVIACNFSAQPVTLSLKADMKSNGVRGSFLRTIVRTDHGMARWTWTPCTCRRMGSISAKSVTRY